jgi:hypothetical protein
MEVNKEGDTGEPWFPGKIDTKNSTIFHTLHTNIMAQTEPLISIVPEGIYYIGDPCYILSDNPVETTGILIEESTVYGTDGEGTNGMKYLVDSGAIGMVHKSLWDKQLVHRVKEKKLGTFHQFRGPVTFTADNGCFTIMCPNENFYLEINCKSEDDEEA